MRTRGQQQILAESTAAHLIFEESKYCHVTPRLKSLHWFPVRYRIIFRVLLITFKANHGLAPVYINELISIRDVSSSRYSGVLGPATDIDSFKLMHSSIKPLHGLITSNAN